MKKGQNTNEYATWIGSMLDIVAENPNQNIIDVLGRQGKSCAQRRGFMNHFTQMRQTAPDCQSRAEWVEYLNKAMPSKFEEASDGIVMHLGNEHCNCPMAEKIGSPMLCHCTQGNVRATWSEFFGKPIEVDIVETILRGGKECVFKIRN